jgi:CDP-diacylglycerol--glycerol-3-phosphate 3-phosphatidyltransferase
MVSSAFKPAVSRVIEPIARAAARVGVTPNAVTIFGTVGTISAAIALYPHGHLFLGTIVITIFVLSDLFDGAIARISESGASAWGGFLDSTCDRITDAAILGALAMFCIIDENQLAPLAVCSLVAGFLVSYIRAKSESYGISCTVGIAERTERLILILVAVGLSGLGVPYVLAGGLWILLIISTVTAVQRFLVVREGLRNL